jgi:tripartite-type tricarboxylate transporter receptor subunit TctC
VKETLLTAGSPVQYQDATEFSQYVDADAAKMREVVQKIGKLE